MKNKTESTVFKKRQKVYDQIFKPDMEGKVRCVSVGLICNYIIVDFEDDTALLYTFEGVMYDLENNYKHSFPTLSVKPYSADMKGFSQEEIDLPATLENATDWLKSKGDFYVAEIDYSSEPYTSKEMFNAFEALKRLIFLRDYCNKGWQPDWSKRDKKYCIEYEESLISPINHIYNSRVMAFKTAEIRDKFLEEQRELLEMAKPLL